MRRLSLHPLWLLLAFAGCPMMGQPTLELSVAGTGRVDADISVGVSATAADGTPGQGTVAISTSLGTLGASTLMLAEGTSRTTLKCPRSLAGCAAGASITITARWTIPGGTVVTQTATLRLIDPMPTDGGVQPDGGTDGGDPDAGSDPDAGAVDAGDVDGGEPELDAGTPLILGPDDGLVLGRFGAPRTVGFSTFSSSSTVSLGFDSMPERPILYGGRLLYVRNGQAFVWVEDYVDGGPPRPPRPVIDAGTTADAGAADGGRDGGSVDGGATDGGRTDGGAADGGRDGGFDAGPPPPPPFILDPEGNDDTFATCIEGFSNRDAGYVRALLPTPLGGLWVACSRNAASPVSLFLRDSEVMTTSLGAAPLAAHESSVLAMQADGGLAVISASGAVIPPASARRFSSRARSVPAGFELLSFDPTTGLCSLALFRLGTTTPEEYPLPAGLPVGEACLDGVLWGRRDVLLYPAELPDVGVTAIPFSRGGRDAGLGDGGLVFVAGPPSNLSVDPPVLSIDFASPVEVLAR